MAAVMAPPTSNSLTDPHLRLRTASIASSSSSSATSSFDNEDTTVTGNFRTLVKGKQRSQDDLRMLAVSSTITEISYNISDIQTRIFEIQELRHQDLGSTNINGASSSTSLSGVIDQALIRLDERLETVAQSIATINDSLQPLLHAVQTPTQTETREDDVDLVILRKHSALIAEWESVQTEAGILRDELKEDKWLAVFRNASDQADGMMASLEKVITHCHDFIWQVHRRGQSEDNRSQTSSSASAYSEANNATMDAFLELQKSLEAKKKYYMPSITKVLSVLDKGVRDRVTKNGECLRRHADMRARWKSLKERIGKTDIEMEGVRRALLDADHDPSEAGSVVSRLTATSKTGVGTPVRSRASSSTSAIARSISPLRKFAARMTRSTSKQIITPTRPPTIKAQSNVGRTSSNEPASTPTLRQRASFFHIRARTDVGHKHSSSTQLTTPLRGADENPAITGKPRWNVSTRPDPGEPLPIPGTMVPPSTPPRRPSGTQTPVSSPYFYTARSVSRMSQGPPPRTPNTASSPPVIRPSPPAMTRPVSRQAHARSESRQGYNPRFRPTTPSQIPLPNTFSSRVSQASSDDREIPTSLMQRAMSPSPSASTSSPKTSPQTTPQKRGPRQSLIPLPRGISGGLRAPSPAMSRAISTSPASRRDTETPEPAVPLYPFFPPSPSSNPVTPSRPGPKSILKSGPPSSFRDGPPSSSRPPSRPASRVASHDRSNMFTPTLEQSPAHIYIPLNKKDPLDAEVAHVVNSIPHGFLIERVDPTLKRVPTLGEENKAQYAMSNALGRKVVTCRLIVINRSAPQSLAGSVQTKKVMCRVGGGWQDLDVYLFSRQAGTI